MPSSASSLSGTSSTTGLAPPSTLPPTWQQVLALTWPVLMQQALVFLVGQFDRYLGGSYQPPEGADHVVYQSAQATANYLAWFLSSFSALVSVGSTALIARFVGAGEIALANRALHQSVLLALLLGAIGTVAGYFLIDDIVALLASNPEAAAISADFLKPILALLALQVLELAGIACLVGAGDTRTGLWVLGGVAIANIPFAFIGRACFGFTGIAMGTAFSHLLGAVAVVVVLVQGRAKLQLRWQELAIDLGLMRRLLRVSIPASIDVLSMGLCQLWFLSLITRLPDGNVATSAHGIAIGWEGLGYLSGQAFATAATALVGQNLGARRPAEAAKAGWTAFAMGACCMSYMGMIFFVLAPAMMRLHNPNADQISVIEAGVPLLRLVAFAMPALSAIIILNGALRGAGDTRIPMVITWIGFLVIRLPLAYLLMFDRVEIRGLGSVPGWGMGLYGAWLAMFVDLSIRGVFFVVRFAGGRWKSVRV